MASDSNSATSETLYPASYTATMSLTSCAGNDKSYVYVRNGSHLMAECHILTSSGLTQVV